MGHVTDSTRQRSRTTPQRKRRSLLSKPRERASKRDSARNKGNELVYVQAQSFAMLVLRSALARSLYGRPAPVCIILLGAANISFCVIFTWNVTTTRMYIIKCFETLLFPMQLPDVDNTTSRREARGSSPALLQPTIHAALLRSYLPIARST